MQIKNLNVYFFIIILLGISWATFFLFKPFLSAIIVAAILAATFHGSYEHLAKKTQKRRLSSFLTCVLVLFIIVLPTIIIFGLVANEINGIYQKLVLGDHFYQNKILTSVNDFRNSIFAQTMNLDKFLDQGQINKSIESISSGIFSLIQKIYQNVIASAIWIFVMFFSLYYFLVESKTIIKKIMYLSPLRDEYEEILTNKFNSMVKATLKGTIIVGFIQGILGGIMFAIAGVPSFVIWGIIMIVLSMIPVLGSGLVWAPVGIIMLLTGNIWQGIFILAFGGLVISFIDNVLRPKLVGGDTEIHPLLVFFATLGGIISFGLIGFVVGPVIMALFLALWDIYGKEFNGQLKKINA